MTDIYLNPDGQGGFDALLYGGDLVRDDGLRTAVFISLFTDAQDDTQPAGQRRGWWGDAVADVAGDRIGSLLWRLSRAKVTDETRRQANEYARQALQWLIDDGVASTVTVALDFDTDSRLVGLVEITRPQGTEQIRLADLWAASYTDPRDPPNASAASAADAGAALAETFYLDLPETA